MDVLPCEIVVWRVGKYEKEILMVNHLIIEFVYFLKNRKSQKQIACQQVQGCCFDF